MSKSVISTANTNIASVVTGTTLDLGNIVRRFGCNCKLSGNSVLLDGEGYYGGSITVTASPTAVGTFTITALLDGAVIPGATATASVSTANNPQTITIPFIARVGCCKKASVLTFVFTGTTSAISNISAVVEKV